MSKNRKQPISFVEPPEPAFIRRMKEQMGYKEGPTVDTKLQQPDESESDDVKDRDDEKPTVVVLKSGDLTEEEAKLINVDVLNDGEERGPDGKIKFKKPLKRSAETDEAAKQIKLKLEKKESQMAQVKNKSLLSFDDEEDDDD